MSPGDVAALLSISAAATGMLSGGVAYLLGRRKASGRIDTSEAAVLWAQAQDMRAMLLAEKTRAEEQRDKLIDAYTQQILPTLGGINKLTGDLIVMVTDNSRLIQEIDANLRKLQGTS